MERCALVKGVVVVNIVEYDGDVPSDFCGCSVIQSDMAQIGWTYANGEFTAPPAPTPTPIPLPAQAQSALTKTDTTVLRCYSAGVAVPADIQAYRLALRAIANGRDTTSVSLPTEPTDYPSGT